MRVLKLALIVLLLSMPLLANTQELTYPKEKFPYCLNLRGQDFECQRGDLNSVWACEKKPVLGSNKSREIMPECIDGKMPFNTLCTLGDEDEPEIASIIPKYEISSVDKKTNSVEPKLSCNFLLYNHLGSKSSLPEVVNEDLSLTLNMQLHKNKFPGCVAVRTQNLECSRSDVTNDWSCEKRLALQAPRAVCYTWLQDVVDGICSNRSQTGGHRYVPSFSNVRINMLSKTSEPKLICASFSSAQLLGDKTRHVPLNQD